VSEPVSSRPHRLGPNKVPVYYAGGEGIDRFRGERGSAGPEDWVGSVTPFPSQLLTAGADPSTGVSRLDDGTLLDAAIRADPQGWIGPELSGRYGAQPGLLVKLLDAGERLPVHCHPSRPFATAHLGSRFGKTEGWIVIASVTGARVWLGFSRRVPSGELRSWIRQQDASAMLGAMNELAAEVGDVFYVPAGVPHAIGTGVTIVELQEPTSFSVLAEHAAFGVDAHNATLGLGWDLALTCFDLSPYTAERLAALQPTKYVTTTSVGGTVSRLFGTEAEPFFQAYRVRSLSGVTLGTAGFRVLVVEQGEGEVAFGAGSASVRAGETWVVPYGAGEVGTHGELELIVCCPPTTAES
jgi:mannose-6-phosphate isomerase